MPLNLAALTTVPGLPGAGERAYPHTIDDAARAWASALALYAAPVFPPLREPPVAAQDALYGALKVAFALPVDLVPEALESALRGFAVALAALMAPAYAALPPAGQVGFRRLFTTRPFASTRVDAVGEVAGAIDLWMRTGTAQLVAPVPPPPVPWS